MTAASHFPAWRPPPMTISISPDAASRCRCRPREFPPDFFEMLGVKPQLGRFFLPEEGQPAGKPVIVISDALWHNRFGGDTKHRQPDRRAGRHAL